MSPDRLRGILDLVEDSLDRPGTTGGELADRAFLSRFHFDRLVLAALGEPPGAFRRRLLLERAADRLVTTAEPVIEIALGAGYGSPEAFSRAFRRAYGVPPSEYRRAAATSHDLSAASGIHFHPPGGLRLPALSRSTAMNVLTRMLDHHLWLVGEIIDRLDGLDQEILDRPIELSVEGIDRAPTLRSVADRLVGQLEMWVRAVEGGARMPASGDTTAYGLRARLDTIGPVFRDLLVTPLQDGRADETFVDATCDPPETFSYGGVLAHVLTFSAVRRTMAVGALESAGIDDLGAGDPMAFVGGTGSDASTIRRNSE
ncbi:MAG: helix-turn-helix domain-containing protein [Nocardioidaceae bacterium]